MCKHKKCFRLLCLLCVASIFFACDETTTGIGESIVPNDDRIAVGASSYEVSTRSILADSLYSRSSMAYLGKYTDPENSFSLKRCGTFAKTMTFLFVGGTFIEQ